MEMTGAETSVQKMGGNSPSGTFWARILPTSNRLRPKMKIVRTNRFSSEFDHSEVDSIGHNAFLQRLLEGPLRFRCSHAWVRTCERQRDLYCRPEEILAEDPRA